jgi:hypothetical protein
MNTKILVPIISAEAIEIALGAIDSQEYSLIYDRNWDPSMSEYLAQLRVAKEEFDAYAQQMTQNFGCFYGSSLDRDLEMPLETSQFSLAVKNMVREIYGEYLPIIDADAEQANHEQAHQ